MSKPLQLNGKPLRNIYWFITVCLNTLPKQRELNNGPGERFCMFMISWWMKICDRRDMGNTSLSG